MPKFAPVESIVDAYFYSGVAEGVSTSAVEVGKSLGAQITMTFIDGLALKLDDVEIPPSSWVYRSGGGLRVVPSETFSDLYAGIYDSQGAASHPAPPRPRPAPVDDGEIRDGDIITFPGADPKDTYEVMEIDGDTLVCDSEWGEKRVPKDAATLVKRP